MRQVPNAFRKVSAEIDGCGYRLEAANLPEARRTEYTYDQLNRVQQKRASAVSVYDSVTQTETLATPTETYTYDAVGNQILRASNGSKTYTYYDALNRKRTPDSP